MALQQEEVLYRIGYDIGLGVAMATGSPMALGVRGDVTPPQIGTGGAGSFTFRRIDTTEDLEKELDIGAEASGGIGLFSASASFGFSERCKIHSSSLTVLVSAKEELAFQQMDSPELTPAAAMLVENGKPIVDQFGDYFIRGIKTGGRFFGIIRIETRSEQAKTELDAELSGSYGLAISVDAKLRISEAMSRSSGRSAAFINYEGGRVITRPTSNNPVQALEQLFKAMDEWTTSVRNDPKAYSVTLAPYIIALGPTPPNIAEIENQRDVLIRCAKLRSQNLDKLNLIDYILDPKHINEFEIIPPPQGPDLPALQAALARDRDVIADAASFAINNIKKACDPETYMREVKGVADFRLTALPTNLPRHRGGLVQVTSLENLFFNMIFLVRDLQREFDRVTVLNVKQRVNSVNNRDYTTYYGDVPTQQQIDFITSDVVLASFHPNLLASYADNPAYTNDIVISTQSPNEGVVPSGSSISFTYFST